MMQYGYEQPPRNEEQEGRKLNTINALRDRRKIDQRQINVKSWSPPPSLYVNPIFFF